MKELLIHENAMTLMLAILAISLGLCIVWITQLRNYQQRQRKTTQLMVQQAMQAEMNAMSSSMMILGERLLELEDNISQVHQRQEMFEGNGRNHSYGDAMEMARQGASSEELQDKCRISRTEADLIVLLHGKRF